MMLLGAVIFLLYWICLLTMQFCTDLHRQVSCHGEVFTKVVGEWQNSSVLLASHLNSNSLSYGTLLLKVTRLSCLDIKRGKSSLQDGRTKSSLYIYGQYVMENSQNSGYSMTQLP